jgi:hypothetical protein
MRKQNKIINDRLQLLFEQGTFIESCSYYNYTFSLFSLNRDFIEVLRDTNTNKIIWAMDANDQDLKKYLDKVLLSLEEILK